MIITVAYIHLKTSMGRKFQKPKLRVDFTSSKMQTSLFLAQSLKVFSSLEKPGEFRGKRLSGTTFQLNMTSKILGKASFLSRNIQFGKSEIAMHI